MTDFVWDIGNGNMMIRDTGTNVEFWFQAGSQTYNHQQNYAYTINGHTVSGTYDMVIGGAYQRIGYENVTTDQTVSFTMYDEGLGWATTTHSAFIDRASAPSAPAKPIVTVRSSTSIELDLGADGANNGAAIDSRQYSGSTSSAGAGTNARNAVNNYIWAGLQPGTKYYLWERTHNAKGYSPWSAAASVTTWDVPDAPSAPTITNVKDTSVDITFTDGANNGQAIDTRQITYGVNPSGVQTTVTSDGSTTLTGLTPGTVYYVWDRTHNSVGYSAWSARGTFTTKRAPDAPTTPTLSEVTMTSMRTIFSVNGDGGSPFTGYRIGYGTDSSAPQAYLTSDRDDVLTGLFPGTTYYVWGQASNIYGWGPLSATPASVRTVAGAKVYSGVTPKDAVAWVNVAGVWKKAKPWAKIAGVWKETK